VKGYRYFEYFICNHIYYKNPVGHYPQEVQVGFTADKVTLRQVFLALLLFPFSESFQQFSGLIPLIYRQTYTKLTQMCVT